MERPGERQWSKMKAAPTVAASPELGTGDSDSGCDVGNCDLAGYSPGDEGGAVVLEQGEGV